MILNSEKKTLRAFKGFYELLTKKKAFQSFFEKKEAFQSFFEKYFGESFQRDKKVFKFFKFYQVQKIGSDRNASAQVRM